MSFRKVIIPALVLAVCAFLSAYRPGGMMAYFAPSACWTLVALAVLWASGRESLRSWYRKPVALMAAAVAGGQILIYMDAGLLTGFGESPVSFSPLTVAINMIYVLTNLLGVEFSRAYIMKSYGLKKPVLTLGVITLLYTNLYVSLAELPALFNSSSPLPLVTYLGEALFPALMENLLATYLALLGGPIASLAYRAPLSTFQWFVPILPDLTWGFKALLGTVPPTLGFIYVNQAVTIGDLRRIGIKVGGRELVRLKRREREERSSLISWTAISVAGILMVWFFTGLLGVYPTVPLSGSMRPTMEVGDLAVLVKTQPQDIKVDDIIQFWREEEMIMHRVDDIRQSGDTILFITKGDANSVRDSDPVFPQQVRGKVLTIIPKIGWTSLYIKEALSIVWAFFFSHTALAYGASAAIAVVVSIYTVHGYRRKRRSWIGKR